MILQNLFESLQFALLEARVQRTIDKKLWLSVASTCSRNKDTEAEYIKPLSRETKDILLQKYVAALIIMRKPCPKSVEDIDTIKTFKNIGHSFIIAHGGTIKEIQDLYNINTGVAVDMQKETQKELTQDTQEVNDTPEEQVSVSKNIDADNIKLTTPVDSDIISYEDIAKQVSGYKSIKLVCKDIYNTMKSAGISFNKSCYKFKDSKGILCFVTSVHLDKYSTIAFKQKCISITITKYVNITSVKETFVVNTELLTVNDSDDISPDTNLSFDDFSKKTGIPLDDILRTILVKLLYVVQKNLQLSDNKLTNKQYLRELLSIDPKNISYTKDVSEKILQSIHYKLIKNFSAEELFYLMHVLTRVLVKYNPDKNEDNEVNIPFTIKYLYLDWNNNQTYMTINKFSLTKAYIVREGGLGIYKSASEIYNKDRIANLLDAKRTGWHAQLGNIYVMFIAGLICMVGEAATILNMK